MTILSPPTVVPDKHRDKEVCSSSGRNSLSCVVWQVIWYMMGQWWAISLLIFRVAIKLN